MSWFSQALTSSIGRKVLMALSGLFLCSFLVVHLSGNLQLLKSDGGLAFNAYAKFMTTFPLIKFLSYGLYATFLLHIIQGFMLTQKNSAARPQGYKVHGGDANSSWTSRNMGLLGALIFFFLVVHLANFWFQMHFGELTMDTAGNKDLFKVVQTAFSQWWYVALYTISMIVLGLHLYHGFKSAFQTLGLNHVKYNNWIESVGFLFALIIPLVFALIPLFMFMGIAF